MRVGLATSVEAIVVSPAAKTFLVSDRSGRRECQRIA